MALTRDRSAGLRPEMTSPIVSREVSSEEVTQAHLDRIGEVDGDVRAFLLVDHDGACCSCFSLSKNNCYDEVVLVIPTICQNNQDRM